jgi:hypothetical protein
MAYASPPPQTFHLRLHLGSSHWRIPRSGGPAASQCRPTNQDYDQNDEDIDVDFDSQYESSPVQRPCQRLTPAVRHPTHNSPKRNIPNKNSVHSIRTADDIFHDALSNGISGQGSRTSKTLTNSGRNRGGPENPDRPVSPRRRRQLNDRSVIEEWEEINLLYETDKDYQNRVVV